MSPQAVNPQAVALWGGDWPWRAMFVSGTDTEVGKTVTTACLAAALRNYGPVRALKPVASGVQAGTEGEDATLLAGAAGHPIPSGSVKLRAPRSPARAAREEGVVVDLQTVADWVAANVERGGATLVEGVGGWEVPVGASWRVADLAESLGWPVLVVASDRLGVINHTLLTVAAVRLRGLRVAGVVLTRSDSDGNREDLRALLPDLPIVSMATLELSAGNRPLVEVLAEAGAALLRDLSWEPSTRSGPDYPA